MEKAPIIGVRLSDPLADTGLSCSILGGGVLVLFWGTHPLCKSDEVINLSSKKLLKPIPRSNAAT